MLQAEGGHRVGAVAKLPADNQGRGYRILYSNTQTPPHKRKKRRKTRQLPEDGEAAEAGGEEYVDGHPEGDLEALPRFRYWLSNRAFAVGSEKRQVVMASRQRASNEPGYWVDPLCQV